MAQQIPLVARRRGPVASIRTGPTRSPPTSPTSATSSSTWPMSGPLAPATATGSWSMPGCSAPGRRSARPRRRASAPTRDRRRSSSPTAISTMSACWRIWRANGDAPVWAHPSRSPTSTAPPPIRGRSRAGGGLVARLSPLFPRAPSTCRSACNRLPDDGTVPPLPGWRGIHTPGAHPRPRRVLARGRPGAARRRRRHHHRPGIRLRGRGAGARVARAAGLLHPGLGGRRALGGDPRRAGTGSRGHRARPRRAGGRACAPPCTPSPAISAPSQCRRAGAEPRIARRLRGVVRSHQGETRMKSIAIAAVLVLAAGPVLAQGRAAVPPRLPPATPRATASRPPTARRIERHRGK